MAVMQTALTADEERHEQGGVGARGRPGGPRRSDSPRAAGLAHLVGVCVAALAAAWCGAAHATEPPAVTNARLLAAMPEGVESVLVLRADAARAKDSQFKTVESFLTLRMQTMPPGDAPPLQVDEDMAVPQMPIETPPELAARDLRLAARAAATHAVPVVVAYGWSWQGSPEAAGGVGNIAERWIVVSRDPLDSVNELVGKHADLLQERFEHAGVAAYKVTARVTNTTNEVPDATTEAAFLATLDERVLLCAEDKSELLSMIDAWRHPFDELPTRWATAGSSLPLDGVALIARRVRMPGSPQDGATYIVALPEAARVQCVGNVLSERPEAAHNALYQPLFGRESPLGPSAFHTTSTMRADGFSFDATLRDETPGPRETYALLIVMSLLGGPLGQ